MPCLTLKMYFDQIYCYCVSSILDFKILAKFLRLQYNLVDDRNLSNHF